MRHSSITGLALATMLAGCGDAGGPDVQPGVDALARCDIHGAHDVYASAYAARSGDPDVALGYAITDMLLLGEDPEGVQGLALFGFTGGFDPDDLLTGPSALLDGLTRHTPSRDYGDHVRAVFPYPPFRGEGHGLDRIAPETRALDVVQHGWAMEERFARLAAAFETAARGAPRSVTIDGICGVGTVELQAPELYLLAATWQAMVLVLEISRGYDWDFLLRDAIDWRDGSAERLRAQVEVLNTHLGALANPGALGGAREAWRRFFDLMNAALEAADGAGAPGPDALVEWRAYRAGLLPAMLEQGRAARQLADGTVTAPGLTPEWSGQLGPFFDGQLDLADFGRTFSVYEDPMWGDAWVEVDEAPIDMVLMRVLSRSPFDDTIDRVEWTHLDAWRGDRTDWQITSVPSTRSLVSPIDVPRFISPTVERYRDHWYFE